MDAAAREGDFSFDIFSKGKCDLDTLDPAPSSRVRAPAALCSMHSNLHKAPFGQRRKPEEGSRSSAAPSAAERDGGRSGINTFSPLCAERLLSPRHVLNR